MLLTEQRLEWELMLDPAGRSGAANMTIDADLLAETARTGRAFLRLYRFDPRDVPPAAGPCGTSMR